MYRYLPDYRDEQPAAARCRRALLFSSGIALLSYVLEVFGEHRLGALQVLALLGLSRGCCCSAYGLRSARGCCTRSCGCACSAIRTFRAAVGGSFFTRLAIGGVPFLFPLLYQVGLGYTPVQSGLLMMPQAAAAISLKVLTPRILARLRLPRACWCHEHRDARGC